MLNLIGYGLYECVQTRNIKMVDANANEYSFLKVLVWHGDGIYKILSIEKKKILIWDYLFHWECAKLLCN